MMKKATLILPTLLLLAGSAFSQNALTAPESNPNAMGWMQGFPPEKGKLLYAKDGSFFTFPGLRYSVNHIREFYPTKVVPASEEDDHPFKIKLDKKIDQIQFVPWEETSPITWKESLDRNYTDGIIVLHKGKIVYEAYPAGLTAEGTHAAMSVSKSFAGTIAAILIAENRLDPKKLVTDYIPELKGSGFEGATVENVLDMTTAIQYSENYNDPKAEIWKFSESGNLFRPDSYKGPQNYYEYLKTVKKIPGKEHGEEFGYKTINTELIGWIVSRITGKSLADLVSEKIWKPMGAVYDGYYQLGTDGIAFAGGGFNLNLRDMALFGELLRNGGVLDKKRILPKEAVQEISRGGSPEKFSKGGEYPKLSGWSYHNMWWITNNANGAFMARGVHGQAIYVDPAAKMVIVRFASNPQSSNKFIDPISIPAYEALANYLMRKK
ncbi:serine hydrolase [uncultured Fibrobacter sp.]|uniref:serine hydrolase domain-containing protein n=1 Tax=uncultured Fibrobacter sp. TaxID=261512 RepID=UPI0028061EC9|nr:serine hydrolase [uncultured Fibrobacter sp.]